MAGWIDNEFASQLETEIKYWRDMLKQVVAVVKTFSIQSIPFRGHNYGLGSTHAGNFEMALELIAEFHPFLAKHIEIYENKGKGKHVLSFLSNL